MKIKILLMAVVLAGLLFSLSASAQDCLNPETTELSCGVVPSNRQLSYEDTIVVDKFDQSLGELLEVRMTAQACGNVSAELDSEDQTPQAFDLIAFARVIATLPNEGEEVFEIGLEEIFEVSADDEPGSADFAGPDYSGIFALGSEADPVCTDEREFTYTGAQMDPFIGDAGDELSIPLKTQSGISAIGSVSQDSRSSASMGIEICVEYVYCPVPDLCINGTKIDACSGEGLAGWIISIRDASGRVITTATTDENGDYSFCDLLPGSYTVCEVGKAGWKPVGPTCRDVTLVDANEEGVDFENEPAFCISGFKFNGTTGEEGLAGWTIQLKDAAGAVVGTTTTGADGSYEFCSQFPGTYTVSEITKSGWTPIGPTSIPVTLECDNLEDIIFRNTPVETPSCGGGCPWFIKNELYKANCRELLVVNADKGILANDHDGTWVINPESITIDPKYGTITVEEDGSFVYNPTGATGIRNGVYVIFKYAANNGFCDAKYLGIAKIQVACK